jgi:hypothetical protein
MNVNKNKKSYRQNHMQSIALFVLCNCSELTD